jgi:hypothetical protein
MRFSTNLSAFLVLFLGSLACGQTRGPATVEVAIGRLATVPIIIDGDESNFAVLGGDYFDSFREFSAPNELRLRVLGYANGTGWIVVSSVKAGKLQPLFTVRVVVGAGPGPAPPGPVPVPPGPQPGPLDPLATAIRDAAKADGFTKLAALATGLTTADAISKSRAQWTVAELSAAWQTAMRSAVGGPTPANLRKVLGDQLNAALPRESEHVLTTDEMVKARELILKLAKACSEAAR